VNRVTVRHHERLLRGSAAAKSLSRCGRVHHRGGIYRPDRVRRFSGVGIAKLDIAPCGRALVDGISHRIDSGVGLRRHSARNSRNSGACHAGAAPSPQFDNADRNRRDHLCWSRLLPFAPSVSPQGRQVDCRDAVSEPE
jgi:hypothetical protein